MFRLPPLRLLVTFDTVARLGAMREAALELNVTQPAITQALRALEDHIGVVLFDRRRRPARLTPSGHILAQATRESLEMISTAIDEIQVDAAAQGQQLTVSCTLGMATYWLMPRLSDFYAKHPDIMVNVQAPPTDIPTISLGVDLALRYGKGRWTDGQTTKLFNEVICPVGRPETIEQLINDGLGLDQAQLIHVNSPDSHHWAGWDDYLKSTGLKRPALRGQIFDNYIQAVQAAQDGRGLVLGWRSITEALVAEGALVAWPKGEIDMGTAYFVTVSETAATKASTIAFMAWLDDTEQH